jgi:hypothetical protein
MSAKQPRLSNIPAPPPGYVLMDDATGNGTVPPPPPGFELMPSDDGESWSPNAPEPQQRVDPSRIPTKGAIEPYDPSMAESVIFHGIRTPFEG